MKHAALDFRHLLNFFFLKVFFLKCCAKSRVLAVTGEVQSAPECDMFFTLCPVDVRCGDRCEPGTCTWKIAWSG